MSFSRFKISLQSTVMLFLICSVGTAPASANEVVTLASINSNGAASGQGSSAGPRLSAGGRLVVFSSDASDLVTNDANGRADVFVRDLLTGKTHLVSVNNAGTGSANDDSVGAIISANGRYVVFTSYASNLTANDSNGMPDLFVRDLATGITKLISVNIAGTSGGNNPTLNSVNPAITPDGRFVAFYSAASDLVANDTNNAPDLFVRDVVAGKTNIVSVNRAGNAAGIGLLFTPSISADGRFVAFQSEANDLAANDPARAGGNQDSDVFVRDMAAGVTSLVSLNQAATASANGPSRFPSMSADGRFIVFESYATNLVANDTNLYRDVYVRDMAAGITTLVSVNRAGATGSEPSNTIGAPVINSDGRVVAFASAASDLVANDTNLRTDVFVRNLQTKTTTLVSRNNAGTNGGNGDSQNPIVSADGRFVAFESLASDLSGASDTNGKFDIFVRDLQAGATTLVSANSAGTASGNDASGVAGLSADGQAIAFQSVASNLVVNDTNRLPDVFVRLGALQNVPQLITEENTERAIALDSVTLMRDPFPVITPYNFSSDHRTRVTLFATHVELAPGENSSIVTAQAEDSQHRIYPLTVEYVGAVPNPYWMTQVVVKLPDALEGLGDIWVSVSVRGATSNKAVITIRQS